MNATQAIWVTGCSAAALLLAAVTAIVSGGGGPTQWVVIGLGVVGIAVGVVLYRRARRATPDESADADASE